jgi:hypothetical protein
MTNGVAKDIHGLNEMTSKKQKSKYNENLDKNRH